MKTKIFTLLLAVAASVGNLYASKDVVPSDADLASYATGAYTMCIYNEAACNDIVLIGTYVSWNTGAELLKFQAVEGFDGWYVVSWDDETDPTADGGVQAKPVHLDKSGNFSWDYQLGADAELIRGTAELVSANNGTEVDIKNIGAGIVVIDVKSWKTNPCTIVYHIYNFTMISPDCNDEDFITPAISGGFNNWAQEALTLNELKTAERQLAELPGAVFEISFMAAEGTEFKFRSSEEWGKEWTNELKEYDAENDGWKGYNNGANLVLGEETDLFFDLGDPELYSWTNCEKPSAPEYVVIGVNVPAGAPAAGVEIIGTFDEWAGTAMELLNTGWYFAELEAAATDQFKFREAGTWDNEIVYVNKISDGGEAVGLKFMDVWKEDTYKGTPCKIIELDLSNPDMYRWSGEYQKEVVLLSDVANYIDFQALSVSDPAMTSHKVTSTDPYTLANGTVLRGYYDEETSAEVDNVWNVKEDYYTMMPTPEWRGVDLLKAGTAFRAASGTYIEIGAFQMNQAGKLVVYFQPNGDSDRGISVSILGGDPIEIMKSGVKINDVRPAYAVEFDLPVGSYEAGDVIITVIGKTVNIFGVRIGEKQNAYYEITTNVLPENTGQVKCVYGKTKATMTAKPNIGYHFTQWSDGVTDNPRTIVLTQDTTFTAEFAKNTYSFNVTCDAARGTVDAENGNYPYLTELTMSATPKYGYHFTEWSDNNTDNPRTITLMKNTELEAVFIPNKYSISDNSTNGHISGTGSFDYLSERTIEAVPDYGYHFTQWSDGVADNPRTIVLTQDTTFTAEFAVDTYGKCGENLEWTLLNDTLNITGTGDMWDEQPWIVSREAIKQVNLPQGITSIGNNAFAYCSGLTSLYIPSNVTRVGYNAFYGCNNIVSFEGPIVAFNQLNSEKIQSLTLNGGNWNDIYQLNHLSEVLTKLDVKATQCSVLPKYALYNFYTLRELVLPGNVTTIGYMSVAGCKNLQSIIIPASVIDIAQSAFEDCRSIKALTFEEGCQLQTIGSWAFYNCHALQDLNIPEGVTEIGDGAFYGCTYLNNLSIPASVQSIGDNAFALCSKLAKMDVDALLPPEVEDKTFYEVSTEAPVYVPDESVDTYKSHAVWGRMNIVGKSKIPTVITDKQSDKVQSTKVLRNGQIFILRGEKVYTVTGQEVR